MLAALVLSRWLRALVFDVAVVDPWVYVATAAGILVTAWLAAFVPARRAASVDPMLALRDAP